MKLIIDISDDTYKKIIADKYVIYDKMYYSIKNGTPLDDIKAEIDNQYKWLMQTNYTLYDIYIAFDIIKHFIDRHIRECNDAEWKESEPLDDVVELMEGGE